MQKMKTKTAHSKPQASRSQIYSICEDLAAKIEQLLQTLKVDYNIFENRIVFPCPVHNGDNREGACIFTDGTKSKGNWVCWTHGCEKHHGKNVIGFVKGVLETKYSRTVSFPEALNFCLDFLNKKISDIPDEQISETIYNINKITDIITREPEKVSTNIKREDVLSGLDIPSKYFLDRGYKEETLVAFDVGDCYNPNKQMYNRAVAPIYNDVTQYIGCVGRWIGEDNKKYKWLNSKGFKKSSYLYGVWNAKPHIQRTLTAILVEGQGDVWRLYESGIKNSLGIFGADLGDDQLIALEEMGILNLVILTDSDEAGQKAASGILNKCGRRFNYFIPKISSKDIGEMTVEQIENELKPQIKGLF